MKILWKILKIVQFTVFLFFEIWFDENSSKYCWCIPPSWALSLRSPVLFYLALSLLCVCHCLSVCDVPCCLGGIVGVLYQAELCCGDHPLLPVHGHRRSLVPRQVKGPPLSLSCARVASNHIYQNIPLLSMVVLLNWSVLYLLLS